MTAMRMALVGAPNSGKSTLFNALTGGRARIANYAGVTVERQEGRFTTPGGKEIELVDLPGVYGLSPRSIDQKITLDALQGDVAGSAAPDALVVVVDATNLRARLLPILQIKALGKPMIVVLNMMDLAERDGVKLDLEGLETLLGVPVVPARAVRPDGRQALLGRLDSVDEAKSQSAAGQTNDSSAGALQREARHIAKEVILFEPPIHRATRAIDRVVLHPLLGTLLLAALLFFIFQAVFTWSSVPMDAIEAGAAWLGDTVRALIPTAWLQSLIADGIIAGVGSVVVFLPQIVILFAFILLLEASGYMARAAFLMDSLMLRVGLNGRAFIPLLSSFACAIPGIMAARTIENDRDRLTTIMVAPLMTCSARLPVYTLVIAAFIPPLKVGGLNLQGIVMFGLYIFGILGAITVAFVLKKTLTRGAPQPLIMELPTYKWPVWKDYFRNIWIQARAFLKRAGTAIFMVSIVLWFLVSYPSAATSFKDTFAGKIGGFLEVLVAPIGFNLEIAVALVPGIAAREVAVGALGTVYAVQGGEENIAGLAETLQSAWSLPTAFAFLAWYVFAPMCFATLATIRREANSLGWAVFTAGYLFTLAYVAAGTVFWSATALGL
ncbi:MAG: ferrous iron transporter B [Pseudomonadota bacterium]